MEAAIKVGCDPSTFAEQPSNQPTVASGNGLTYATPLFVNGKLYLFCRSDNGSVMSYGYFLATSIVNGVATWGSFVSLFNYGANTRPYCFSVNIAPNGTDVYLLAVKADYGDTNRRDVYAYIFNTNTNTLRALDGGTTNYLIVNQTAAGR